MSKPTDVAGQSTPLSGMAQLLLAIATICLVWGWILPWWAGRPAMSRTLQNLEQQRIDPSAMFYTDLEAMDSILRKRGVQ